MANHIKTLQPLNRHLTIVPHFSKKETPTGVLLTEDYRQEEDKYVLATIVNVAPDCSNSLKELGVSTSFDKEIIVDRSMIEEVKMSSTSHYMVLENYVVGFLKQP